MQTASAIERSPSRNANKRFSAAGCFTDDALYGLLLGAGRSHLWAAADGGTTLLTSSAGGRSRRLFRIGTGAKLTSILFGVFVIVQVVIPFHLSALWRSFRNDDEYRVINASTCRHQFVPFPADADNTNASQAANLPRWIHKRKNFRLHRQPVYTAHAKFCHPACDRIVSLHLRPAFLPAAQRSL